MERKAYVQADKAVGDVVEALNRGALPEHITLGGSGEPTLNSDMGEIIARLKARTRIPIAVLTNSSTMMMEEVHRDLKKADVVLPSFDAPEPELFGRLNRPCEAVSFVQMAEGLAAFRKVYAGEIWLEIFLVRGLNTDDRILDSFRHWMEQIRPDRIHLNTAVRPTADRDVQRPTDEELVRIRDFFGPRAEIVVPYHGEAAEKDGSRDMREEILGLLERRPSSLSEVAAGLGRSRQQIVKALEALRAEGLIETASSSGITYYQRAGKERRKDR
jgi:wyosine [tRNA(Phe)-imidazoG37] synthetase (radical SAM superfamily)